MVVVTVWSERVSGEVSLIYRERTGKKLRFLAGLA